MREVPDWLPKPPKKVEVNPLRELSATADWLETNCGDNIGTLSIWKGIQKHTDPKILETGIMSNCKCHLLLVRQAVVKLPFGAEVQAVRLVTVDYTTPDHL